MTGDKSFDRATGREPAPEPSRPKPGSAGILAGGDGQSAPHSIPPKWSRHYKRLLELRAGLEAGSREHREAAVQPLEPFGMDMADAATDEFDHDLALSRLSSEQDALVEINDALKRIENGAYGICEVSGKAIPKERLDALPWTRFATDVEETLEKSGEARRAGLGELRSIIGAAKAIPPEEEPEDTGEDRPPSDESLSEIQSAAVGKSGGSPPFPRANSKRTRTHSKQPHRNQAAARKGPKR